jgi:hypothetical protein
MGNQLDRQTFTLGANAEAVQARLGRMAKEDCGARLWRKDASLWKKDPQDQQGIPEAMRRVMRVHLHDEAPHGLETFKFYLEPALEGEQS